VRSLPDLYGVGGLLHCIECRAVQRVQRPGVAWAVLLSALGIWHGLPWVCLRWGLGYAGGVYSRRPTPPGE